MLRVQTAVIGGGVVGIACARALAAAGREVIVLESEGLIGRAQAAATRKWCMGHLLCEGLSQGADLHRGRRMLYQYCKSHGVEYRCCGKLLVATEQHELPMLDAIIERARANGLSSPDEELRRLTASEASALEPAVHCVGAVHSPSTGIVDSHGLMLAMLGEAQGLGATLALGTRVTGGAADGEGLRLQTEDGTELRCHEVVNCAGRHDCCVYCRHAASRRQRTTPRAITLR